MELVQREQLRRDLTGQRTPRLERLPGQLLLERPVRLDLDLAGRRVAELA